MKICRFEPNRLGIVIGDQVADITGLSEQLQYEWPAPLGDAFIASLARLRPELEEKASSAPLIPLADLVLLSPVANPSKIVAAPVNYKAHLDEAEKDPFLHQHAAVKKIETAGLFLKATSSLGGAGHAIRLAFPDRRNDHEVELAVIIGQRAKNVTRENALDIVAGYAIALDMTVRGPEDRSFRKSLDTFTVLGPWLVTADEFGLPDAVDLKLWVGDELRQSANTRDLIMDIPDLIVFATKWYSLHPGDILITGTPAGVGPVLGGEQIRARIDGIGEMVVNVSH